MKVLPILLSFLLVGCSEQLVKDIHSNNQEYIAVNKKYIVKLQDLKEIGWIRKGRYLYNKGNYIIKKTYVYDPLLELPEITLTRNRRRVVLFGNEQVLFSIMRSYQ